MRLSRSFLFNGKLSFGRQGPTANACPAGQLSLLLLGTAPRQEPPSAVALCTPLRRQRSVRYCGNVVFATLARQRPKASPGGKLSEKSE